MVYIPWFALMFLLNAVTYLGHPPVFLSLMVRRNGSSINEVTIHQAGLVWTGDRSRVRVAFAPSQYLINHPD